MKKRAVETAKLTKRDGMTAYTIAAWGKFAFKGDTMRVSVNRIAGSRGGTSGAITVTPSGSGSRVELSWEDNKDKCQKVTWLFWQNLESLIAAGGTQALVGPRGKTTIIITGLFALFTVLALINVISYYNIYQDSSSNSFGQYLGIIGIILNVFVVIVGASGTILSFKRLRYYNVVSFAIFFVIIYILGLVVSLIQDVLTGPGLFLMVVLVLLAISLVVLLVKAKKKYVSG